MNLLACVCDRYVPWQRRYIKWTKNCVTVPHWS